MPFGHKLLSWVPALLAPLLFSRLFLRTLQVQKSGMTQGLVVFGLFNTSLGKKITPGCAGGEVALKTDLYF
jgi:hypothetical protein